MIGKEASFLLRRMQIEDIPTIYTIEKSTQLGAWSEKTFYECLRVGYEGWVIESRCQISAYLLAYIRAGECHILNLCVKEEERRKGYAEEMLKQVLSDAKSQGAEMVILEVRPSNRPAIALYRKLGFHQIGIRKEYYSEIEGNREDALVFALIL